MALPNVPYANQTSPTMDELDQTFAAVAKLGVIPCDATGTNAYVLTGKTDTPTVSAYYNHLMVVFVAPNTSSGLVTLQPFGLSAVPLYMPGTTAVQATTDDIVTGVLYIAAYNSTLAAFVLVSAQKQTGKLLQRVVAQQSGYSATTGASGITFGSLVTVTAADGAQFFTAGITPTRLTSRILVTANYAVSCASSASWYVALCQASNVLSTGFMNVAAGAIVPQQAVGQVQAVVSTSAQLDFQLRAIPQGNVRAQMFINGNQTVVLNQQCTSLIIEEWTPGA